MEDEWIKFLRENHPKLYEKMKISVWWQLEWRDKRIAEIEAENARLHEEIDKWKNQPRYPTKPMVEK